jgi:lipopolysaccharide export LptBFGC system permease protein LptF
MMVFTLHRYIFRELLRVFILATVGLTLILSLGGILRPVQEYGVGPRQVLDILLYFMPITLTFVLPMAALFASALTYGRFASDNEIDACRASGISISTLVYPGLMLALLVAIANLLLSFHVMPYFVHLAEKALKADAKQILFRNLQRRGFYDLPPEKRYLIYADYADPKENTLFGIVVVQSQEEGVRRIIAAEATKVQFDPHDRYTEVQLTTHNAWQMGAAANDLWGHVGAISLKQEFGSLLGDDIKFKRIEEMKQIRGNLMLFEPVARVARAAYVQLAAELLARDISARLEAVPPGFYELQGPSRSVRLAAKGCTLQEQGVVTLVAPIMVEERERASGRYVRRLQCAKAALRVEPEASGLRLSLDIRNARVEETGQLLIQYGVVDLALPDGVGRRLSAKPLLQTVSAEETQALRRGAPAALTDEAHLLDKLQQTLRRKISGTLADIRSETNSRLVFGIGCIPMILIGIGLGIIQKGGHLLGAFGASCVPGALLAVAIISGKHVTENSHTRGTPTGVLIMWGGLVFLVLLTLLIYRRLRRA